MITLVKTLTIVLSLFVISQGWTMMDAISQDSSRGTSKPALQNHSQDTLQVHSRVRTRLYSGLGGTYCCSFRTLPTGNMVTVATTSSIGTDYFTSISQEEIKTASNIWGFNIDLLEYYFSELASLSLTSFNGWSGTDNSQEIKGLIHSESTFFNTTTLLVNFNLNAHMQDGSNYGSDLVNVYNYLSVGPTLNYIGYIKSSAILSDGTHQQVTATFPPVVGVAFQGGLKARSQQGQFNIALRLGFSFESISADNLNVKQNGVQVSPDIARLSSCSPCYLMIIINYDYGWL